MMQAVDIDTDADVTDPTSIDSKIRERLAQAKYEADAARQQAAELFQVTPIHPTRART